MAIQKLRCKQHKGDKISSKSSFAKFGLKFRKIKSDSYKEALKDFFFLNKSLELGKMFFFKLVKDLFYKSLKLTSFSLSIFLVFCECNIEGNKNNYGVLYLEQYSI